MSWISHNVEDIIMGYSIIYRFKGRSKNYEFKCSLILLFLFRSLFVSFVCHFVKFHQSHSPLCSFFNLQKHIRKKNKNQLDVFFRTPLKCSPILFFAASAVFVSFCVISLNSICYIVRYVSSSAYKSIHERNVKINSV